VAERAVRAELHRIGVPAEVARAQIHPQICSRLQRAAAAAAAAEKRVPVLPSGWLHNFGGRGNFVQNFSISFPNLTVRERAKWRTDTMGTVTASISISAAAAVVSRPAGRRRRRGPTAFRCSSSTAGERQALFSRIAPVYDHVRTSRSHHHPSLPAPIRN
jgi:hypothetical protein